MIAKESPSNDPASSTHFDCINQLIFNIAPMPVAVFHEGPNPDTSEWTDTQRPIGVTGILAEKPTWLKNQKPTGPSGI